MLQPRLFNAYIASMGAAQVMVVQVRMIQGVESRRWMQWSTRSESQVIRAASEPATVDCAAGRGHAVASQAALAIWTTDQ